MNQIEFNMTFARLCGNYNKDPDNQENKAVVFFNRFAKIHITNFNNAIDIVMEERDYFPTIAHISKALKKSYENIEKEYPDCRACNNSAMVSMILAYKHINGPDGQQVLRIDEKHFWSLKKKIELRHNGNGKKYYDYSFACRCERGMDYFNKGGEDGYQLSPDEYKELLEETIIIE